jgi:LacI family transcriptional regulator
MTQPRRIALVLDRGLSFVRGVIHGVRAYAADKPQWVLRDGPPRADLVAGMRDWRPHGIIAGLVLPAVARRLLRMDTPLVDVACTLTGLPVPVVDVDHREVGRLAAEYFLDRRFTHFGYFGSESAAYSRIQEASFRQRVAEAGYTVSSCYTEFLPDLTNAAIWSKSARKAHRWLSQLARPAAILCCEDAPARYLADVCEQIGLRVPGDIALLGVGNDELECKLTSPALSSIAVASERIGYEAAAILDRLMSGESPPPSLFLPPLHVINRHSTDIMAVEDDTVLAALQYIRRHALGSLSVARLAHDIAASRRLLERRFRRVLGRSVLEEIQRVRVEHAKELLSDTDLPIAVVANNSGFSSARRLDVLFGRVVGMSPSAYRRQSQVR